MTPQVGMKMINGELNGDGTRDRYTILRVYLDAAAEVVFDFKYDNEPRIYYGGVWRVATKHGGDYPDETWEVEQLLKEYGI